MPWNWKIYWKQQKWSKIWFCGKSSYFWMLRQKISRLHYSFIYIPVSQNFRHRRQTSRWIFVSSIKWDWRPLLVRVINATIDENFHFWFLFTFGKWKWLKISMFALKSSIFELFVPKWKTYNGHKNLTFIVIWYCCLSRNLIQNCKFFLGLFECTID